MNVELDAQAVINDLLEQNKQLTLQLAIARATISQMQKSSAQQQELEHGHKH